MNKFMIEVAIAVVAGLILALIPKVYNSMNEFMSNPWFPYLALGFTGFVLTMIVLYVVEWLNRRFDQMNANIERSRDAVYENHIKHWVEEVQRLNKAVTALQNEAEK